MVFDLWVYLFLSIVAVLVFINSYKYFLIVLIMVELMVSCICIFVYLVMGFAGLDIIFVFYLVFGVCESVLGLGLLVLSIRYYGDDYFKSFVVNSF